MLAPNECPSRDLNALFGGVYKNRRVLVTGHTGFKGSWLAMWLNSMGARVSAISLPAETIPSHHALLNQSIEQRVLDIRDTNAVSRAFHELQPEIVFHLAAQALVRRSYAEPLATFDVNVMGLVNILEAVRTTASVRAVINVTSDKCYRQPEPADQRSASFHLLQRTGRAFTETDALGGHDPYSASKACAEIVAASYRTSFLTTGNVRNVALATARAGNVIGGGDWSSDRLVPDLVRAASQQRAVPIRSPHAVRPWQHVLEPLSGYLLLGQQLLQSHGDSSAFSNSWNFGPAESGHMSVQQIIDGFAQFWPAVRTVVDGGEHPHESDVLRLDCNKAREQLCWQPVWNSNTMLQRTAEWYRAWYENGALCTARDLALYVHDASRAGLCWTLT